jgi:hypothetical protein
MTVGFHPDDRSIGVSENAGAIYQTVGRHDSNAMMIMMTAEWIS